MCVDDHYIRLYKSYFGEDAVDKFKCGITNESEYWRRLYKRTETEEIMKVLKILQSAGFIKNCVKKKMLK